MPYKYRLVAEFEVDDSQNREGYTLHGKAPFLSSLGFWFRHLKREIETTAKFRNFRVEKIYWEDITGPVLPKDSA